MPFVRTGSRVLHFLSAETFIERVWFEFFREVSARPKGGPGAARSLNFFLHFISSRLAISAADDHDDDSIRYWIDFVRVDLDTVAKIRWSTATLEISRLRLPRLALKIPRQVTNNSSTVSGK